MKMKNKKRGFIETFFGVGVIIMFCSLISAIGISQSYHDLNYLKVGPGETKEVIFGNFQNTEDGDIILEIELIAGEEIATLTEGNLDSFVVPAGKLNEPLNVKISIPDEVVEGTIYEVTIQYKDITSSDVEGTVTMTESKTSSIPVLVEKSETETSEGISTWWIVLGILIILVVVVIIYLSAKGKSSDKLVKE